MKLTFPTQAERAKAAWEGRAARTVAQVAKDHGCYVVEREYPETRYVFEDDTQLVVIGTGVAHQVETRLP